MKSLILCLLITTVMITSAQASEVIVKMKSGHQLPKIVEAKNVQILFENTYVIRTEKPDVILSKFKNQSNVVYVERNHRAERSKLPTIDQNSVLTSDQLIKQNQTIGKPFNDPMVDRIWSFKDAADKGVSVTSAYNQYGTTNTTPVIVAVVDTGVDYNHEDLKDIMWTNTKEIPGNGIDDDGNGYVDDIHGINTLIRDTNGKATMDVRDTHSHGSHVSGTIAAKQNNGTGIAGIASNVQIMALRTVPNNADETDVDVAEAFIYAAKNGARIINCSFGKSKNEGRNLIPDTLKYIADNYGVLVIAAAGNDSSDIDRNPTYPASFTNDNLLIIASTNDSGNLSYFSNFGKISVDVAAPGSNIFSTIPGNKYASMSGTSMATPTTVGVAAEILSHFPQLTYLQLKDVLLRSATKIDSFKNKMVMGGRVDLLNGLEIARTIK